jgi:cation transport ATPase
MYSGDKKENIEIRLYKLNKALKSSFSAVKKDVNSITTKKEILAKDLNNKISKINEDFVNKENFQSEIVSLNKKHTKILREIKKRDKLKKELKEALKLRASVDSMVENFKKINGVKKELKNLKNTVVDVNEFNMQTNKFDARIKKKVQDINNIKKDLNELENKFIKESYFNQQISKLMDEIESIKKSSVNKNNFNININRLNTRFKRMISFLKKHPELRKEDKKKIVEIEKSQGKERGVWTSVINFFTEEVEEPKKEKPKKTIKKEKKKENSKGFWKAVVDFFTEEGPEEGWSEKKKEPKKIVKKTNKNKFVKWILIILGILLLFFLYYSKIFVKVLEFIISYKYNILLGIIILAIIIFLSERKEKK